MADNNTNVQAIDTWAIVQQMGHIRLAGMVSEENHFGVVMLRIDIPIEGGKFFTKYIGGSSIFDVSPCSEELARHIALTDKPKPVNIWEMPKPTAPALVSKNIDTEPPDPDEDDGDYQDESEEEKMDGERHLGDGGEDF